MLSVPSRKFGGERRKLQKKREVKLTAIATVQDLQNYHDSAIIGLEIQQTCYYWFETKSTI